MKKKKKRQARKQTLSGLKRSCWKVFSEYIRRKYADDNGMTKCYTCGQHSHWRELQCGHAIPGRHHAVLFDEEICRPQCVRDNVFMGGRYEVFTARLIRENGLEWFERKLAGSRRVVKFTREHLEGRIADFKQRLAGLEA